MNKKLKQLSEKLKIAGFNKYADEIDDLMESDSHNYDRIKSWAKRVLERAEAISNFGIATKDGHILREFTKYVSARADLFAESINKYGKMLYRNIKYKDASSEEMVDIYIGFVDKAKNIYLAQCEDAAMELGMSDESMQSVIGSVFIGHENIIDGYIKLFNK